MPVVPAVVTRNSDDYAALRPNLIDSRASTVGTLRVVSVAKLAPIRSPRKVFLRRNVRALARSTPRPDATERCTDLIVVLSARSLRAGTESGAQR
jgi:hypothetical protein